MHVGLNLIYLVPGETGGPEIYARELIPALRAVAPERALHSLRQPGGCVVGWALDRRGRSCGDAAQGRQPAELGARRAAHAAPLGAARRRRPRPQPGEHGTDLGRVRQSDHDPRPPLHDGPGGPFRPARQGHARPRAGRGPPLGSRDRDLCEHARRRRRSPPSAGRPGRCRPAGSRGHHHGSGDVRGRAPRAVRAREPPGPAQRLDQACPQEPPTSARGARPGSARAASAAGPPGLPDPTRGGAARAGAGPRSVRRRPLPGLAHVFRAGGSLRRGGVLRLHLPLRRLRDDGARGDGTGRAGRRLEGERHSGGGGGRRPALRPGQPRGDRRGDPVADRR